MKKEIVIVIAHASLGLALGKEWKPTSDFLRAVRAVESTHGQFKVGDNGQSLGDFQLSEAAWLDVNEWRKGRGLKTYHYEESVYNAFINRVYASNYLTILHGELRRKLNRPPTHAELYAAYNMGLASFAQVDFQLHRVNPVTREKCRQIGEMLADKEM
jgi:hypothetical protein